MAQIDIQPKQGGMPWWAWLIAAVVLIVIASLIIAALWNNGARVGTEPNNNDVAALPIGDAVANPPIYDNQSIAGAATIESVVSDRAFWVGRDGQRMLVVLDEQVVVDERNQDVALISGQEIALSGTVLSAQQAANIPDIQGLPQQTRQLIERENAFLYVNAPQGIAKR